MSDSFLLHKGDMLKDTHSPVIGFFSVISNKGEFVPIINKYLSNGIGYGYEFAVCLFPDDDDLESEKFGDGVEFSIHSGKSVVLSYEEFYWYLKKACMNYIERYPEEEAVIQPILVKVRERYHIAE